MIQYEAKKSGHSFDRFELAIEMTSGHSDNSNTPPKTGANQGVWEYVLLTGAVGILLETRRRRLSKQEC